MIRIAAFSDEATSDFVGQLRALKRNGLSLMEIRGVNGKNIRLVSEEEAEELAALLKREGIRVWSIGSPIGKMKLKSDGDFEEHKRCLCHLCRLAGILGTTRLRVFSFYEAEDARETVLGYLKEMVEIAAEYGCTLYHENEKQIYGDVAERVIDVLDNTPGLRSVYDPANYVEVGQDVAEAMDLLHERTDYFHVKDALWDTKEIVPAGYGDGRIGEMIARIAPDRDLTLTVEPHLTVFEGYRDIDPTEMKNKYSYPDSDTAFDAAAFALKEVLRSEGWEEIEGGFVKK